MSSDLTSASLSSGSSTLAPEPLPLALPTLPNHAEFQPTTSEEGSTAVDEFHVNESSQFSHQNTTSRLSSTSSSSSISSHPTFSTLDSFNPRSPSFYSDFDPPWWEIPSPWWLICTMPFTVIGMSATLAPRVQIYTRLTCEVLTPDLVMWSDVMEKYTPTHPCESDPGVQAIVAKLIAVMATSSGILSCLTGAWWGSFSDRRGRTMVLAICAVASLIADLNVILVSLLADDTPGGHWLLLIGPLIEGIFGGFASGSAVTHAYIADTTTVESRSRMFSITLGLVYIGMAIGPTIGSLLVRSTDLLSVFYLSAFIHLSYAFVVFLFVPESMTEEDMQGFRRKHQERTNTPPAKSIVDYARGMFSFLAPLGILVPKHNEGEGRRSARRDWSLALIALAYGLGISLMGLTPSSSYVLQYAAATFDWSAEALGYYVALIGASQAVVLLIILPAVTTFFRQRPTVIGHEEPSEEEPLLLRTVEFDSALDDLVAQTPAFDLNVARVGIGIQAIAYGVLSQPLTSIPFTLISMVGSMGACFIPALQSAALAAYTGDGQVEVGKLYSAISVVQALCMQITMPALYGFLYAETVSWFPRGIFILSMIVMAISLFCLLAARLN